MDSDCKIETEIRIRCLKRSRKYTLKDLNELRQLDSYRAMPQNILCSVEILSKGLGLQTVITNSFSTTKVVRLKQVQFGKNLDGYKNYISLIPNKSERKSNIHPTTPTTAEILTLSKRNFDKKIKNWKKDIHNWDAINSYAEIPYHLLTDRMLTERNMSSIMHTHTPSSAQKYIWTPKTKLKNSSEKEIDNNAIDDTICVKKLQFDDDQKQDDVIQTDVAVYSPTRHKWYKPKNGSIWENNIKTDTHRITKDEAIEYLKICISNVKLKIDNMHNQESNINFYDLLLNEFNRLLYKT